MPTYEFRCEAGHSFDRFLKMSEAPLELACAECGMPATRQVSAGAGLVFKGSGFYLTDYGRAGQKPAADEGAAKPAGDSKPADAKTPAAGSGAATPAAATTAPKPEKSSSSKEPKSSE